MTRLLALAFGLLTLAACDIDDSDENPHTDDTDEPSGSACGDPIEDLSFYFRGTVTDGTGMGIGGAEVTLWDQAASPPVALGSDVSGADGVYGFQAEGITGLPNCWLTGLDYRVHTQKADSEDEVQVNQDIWNAWDLHEDIVEVDDLVLKF